MYYVVRGPGLPQPQGLHGAAARARGPAGRPGAARVRPDAAQCLAGVRTPRPRRPDVLRERDRRARRSVRCAPAFLLWP